MQTMQRHFGRYMKRSADDQQVGLLLKDFEDADRLLAQLVEEAKRWRDSWSSILMHQHRLASEFDLLYQPIIGAGEEYSGHVAVQTPEHLAARTSRLRIEGEELKKDLKDILDQVDDMMIKPAQNTRDNLQMLRKTIKKREDKKLDFERYQSRVDSSMKKKGRSERENVALAKAEKDLVTATDQYQAADENLRGILPPLLQAVYSLQPFILAAQVQIQNSLLGHYYTTLHNYCSEEGYPSPAPPMDEVIRSWDDTIKSVQREIEAISIIATGKAVRKGQGEGGTSQSHATNGHRRPSQQSSVGRAPSVSPARAAVQAESRPKISSGPSSTSLLSAPNSLPVDAPPQYHRQASPSPSHSAYATPAVSSTDHNSGGDYFSRMERKTSQPLSSTSANSSTSALSALVAGKKKPPPPPPARLPSHQVQFVTALYDFGGQSQGDLVFKEGDRIRIIKKTDSTDDWWQGELKGTRGMFPANYCS